MQHDIWFLKPYVGLDISHSSQIQDSSHGVLAHITAFAGNKLYCIMTEAIGYKKSATKDFTP